jgi:hypothetical protein
MNNGEQFFNTVAGAEGGISRSLRFNSADSSFLSRTPASAGNRDLWTLSFWVKRCKLGSAQDVFSVGTSGTDILYFDSSDRLCLDRPGATVLVTTQVFRDPSAWYHIVLRIDSTNGTNANKARMYVNGSEITTFSTDNRSGLTSSSFLTNTAVLHTFGVRSSNTSTNPCDIYLADIHMADGSSVDPTSFGEFDANGIWQPITYTGTYGTNGFKLTFGDNSTTAALGNDDSPNSNTWAVNNFSVAAGSGNDSLVDVPVNGDQTDTGAGGEVRGNYATLNPLNNAGANGTYSNGNLEVATGSSQYGAYVSTIATSTTGKWYAEAYITSGANTRFGFVKSSYQPSATEQLGNVAGTMAYRCDSGDFRVALTTKFTGGATCTSGDTVGLAIDLDSGEVKIYKNGSLQGTATGIESANWHFAGSDDNGSGTATHIWNFGQRPFAYTAPSGFKALNTANLPAPVVTKPSDLFDVKLWSGNGSSQTISGLAFDPDFVWVKRRSAAASNVLADVVRGITNSLYSNLTSQELATESDGYVQSVGTGSFSVTGGSNSANQVNASGSTYVGWAWDAGSSTVTNTQGSISSQVRANASAGFSIVSYTGNGASGETVGHGLGVKPAFIITKSRDNSTYAWTSWHVGLSANYYINLNMTMAQDNSVNIFPSAGINSSVFQTATSAIKYNNLLNQKYIAYCFAPVAGYSNAFTWSGTGSTDGPAIYLGFRPKLIIWKRTDSAANWAILDSSRSSYNVADDWLGPNSSSSEAADNAAYAMDFLSNGLKIRATHEATNQSGGTYIGFAWAESPFQFSRAR